MLPSENGLDAWLRYAPLPASARSTFPHSFNVISALSSDPASPVFTAGRELQEGFEKILGMKLALSSELKSNAVVASLREFEKAGGDVSQLRGLEGDGYWLSSTSSGLYIIGNNERAAIYGTFQYLSLLAQGHFEDVSETINPAAPIRFTNEWDNLDGTIERGYAGPSIFWEDGAVKEDLERVRLLARLLSSTGVNGCVVNNVNTGYQILEQRTFEGLKRIANVMRPYGVSIGICLNFDSVRKLGGLPTGDPLDPDVINWWHEKTDELYSYVPDLIGYTVKGDSEGEPGPLKYGRTHAEGANMFAKALQPHGGLVMWRAFVYNNEIQSDDPTKVDRATAACDLFAPMDGMFDDNVVIQIKNGPVDFQVREPVSPLFAHLKQTNMVMEWQHCQEYHGQQTHTVYLPTMFKWVLDTDLRIDGKPSLVRDVVCTQNSTTGFLRGSTTVLGIGADDTWMGNHLAAANFYAFGRMAWDPAIDPADVAREWIRLTFGADPKVMETIIKILLESHSAFENYTGNLGLQSLNDTTTHYGRDPTRADSPTNGGGHWTRAGPTSIGMERTVAHGAGYAGQYPAELAVIYENIETCPDNLLLWFHHVPYTHVLKSGKTVIQHFYDAHYQGSAAVLEWLRAWEDLSGLMDEARFEHVRFRLETQAGQAVVWRDQICNFYFGKSGISDLKGRVRNHPSRIEAQDMELDGYQVGDMRLRPDLPLGMSLKVVKSFGQVAYMDNDHHPLDASGGKCVYSVAGGSVKTILRESGTFDIGVNYWDHLGGTSSYQLLLNDKVVGSWIGNLSDTFLHDKHWLMDAGTEYRVTFRSVEVESGDALKIVGKPDGKELAALDYISVCLPGSLD